MSEHSQEELVRVGEVRWILDRALMQLHRILDPNVAIEASERAIGTALEHVYAADAARADFPSYRGEAIAATEGVRRALACVMETPSEDPALYEVMSLLASALHRLPRLGFELESELSLPSADRAAPFLRATVDRPRLLELRRRVVRPSVPIAGLAPRSEEPPPDVAPEPPRSIEELLQLAEETQRQLEAFEAETDADDADADDAPEPEPAPPDDEVIRERFGIAVGDDELLVLRACETMEDLAMLGRMRRVGDDEPWTSGEESENRIFTKVDAIAACGVETFPELVHMLDDRPVPDAELTFGNVFFFASIAGDDTFDEAMRIVELAELGDPEVLSMTTDALVFAPHPRIDLHLVEWLTAPDCDRRALAAEVLARRGTMTVAQADQCSRDADPRVLASVARALARHGEHESPGLLGWLLHHADESVARAALETAYLLRRGVGYDRAVELCSDRGPSFADAAMFVAIGGPRAARAVLEDIVARASDPAAIRALGWYGDPTFVPYLLGRLEHGDDPAKIAAVEALERLTGASLTAANLAPEYPAAEARPFVRERVDYESPGIVVGDPIAWNAWWKAWGGAAEREARYRWGHRWSAQDNLHELRADFPFRDRRFAAMELAVRTGRPVALDWRAFVRAQREALASLPTTPASRSSFPSALAS